MHLWGDELLKMDFLFPVMDMEKITFQYLNVKELVGDLKGSGSHLLVQDEAKGLSSKSLFEKLNLYYETYRNTDGFLPATFEVIYGHASLGKDKNLTRPDKAGVIHFPLEHLRRL